MVTLMNAVPTIKAVQPVVKMRKQMLSAELAYLNMHIRKAAAWHN